VEKEKCRDKIFTKKIPALKRAVTIVIFLGFGVFSISALIGSCKKPIEYLDRLSQQIPEGFPQPVYTFQDNPLSSQGFELGKKLFYDGRLSIDNAHPCSSCHQQVAAFGTFEHDRSHGVNNSHTLRNAPPLFNLVWQSKFHWDGEFTSLIDESVHPLHGSSEMGETFKGVIDKLQKDETYREMFREVFRYPVIKPDLIQKALAQFTGSMVSANSRYDRYKKGTVFFTLQEEQGYQVYRSNCATCHPEPLFTDHSFRNIGLLVDDFLKDYGRMRITGKAEDSLKFKTPSLRNVYVSSNYMHDGRFNTLSQCINHYRTGVQQSATLDPVLANGISLTSTDVTNLQLFLRTLTDSSFITDPRFGPPQ
jgi:cytochrome c peroxidase